MKSFIIALAMVFMYFLTFVAFEWLIGAIFAASAITRCIGAAFLYSCLGYRTMYYLCGGPMREFFKIWLTLIGFGFTCVAIVSVGIMLFTNSFFWGILYFCIVATGILALMIYYDLHRYD